MNGDAFHRLGKTLTYNLGKHDLLRILGRETSLSLFFSLSLFLSHTCTQFTTDTVVSRTVVMCLSKRRHETNIRTRCNSLLFHCTYLIPGESLEWFVSIHAGFMRTHSNKGHRLFNTQHENHQGMVRNMASSFSLFKVVLCYETLTDDSTDFTSFALKIDINSSN